MPQLNLNSLFIRGNIRTLKLVSTAGVLPPTYPPAGKHWIVLGGLRITAGVNAGILAVYNTTDGHISHVYYNKTATGAGQWPIFGTDAAQGTSQWTPFIIDESMYIYGADVAGNTVHLTVLEW